MQVLRYQRGEHYHAHHDFFDPKATFRPALCVCRCLELARIKLGTLEPGATERRPGMCRQDYANDPYWSSLAAGGARNRMATVFMCVAWT